MKRKDQYFYSAKTAFYSLIAMIVIIISLCIQNCHGQEVTVSPVNESDEFILPLRDKNIISPYDETMYINVYEIPDPPKLQITLIKPDGTFLIKDLSHLIPGKEYIFSYAADTVKIKEK